MDKFIVYQFGKVASTSIVNSLNVISGVEAHQSHFLGRKAFIETLDNLMDPNVLPYFFQHGTGQLVSNIRLMRLVNKHKKMQGGSDTLNFISLSRDPVEWFRSSIAQDVVGYLPKFEGLLKRNNVGFDSQEQVVCDALTILISKICEAIEYMGGIDNYSYAYKESMQNDLAFKSQFDFEEFFSFFSMFMRPFTWFNTHFTEFAECGLEDLEEIGKFCFVNRNDWTKFYVFRYEDIKTSINTVLDDCGFQSKIILKKDNLSTSKDFAKEIKTVFNTKNVKQLRALTGSRYSSFFGYDAR